MLYEYPFSYREDYHLVGGRKVVHRYMVETLPTEIPEWSSADAPIAASWMSLESGHDRGQVHVRFAEGAFFVPLTSDIRGMQDGFDAADLPVHGRTSEAALNNIISLLTVHWDVGRYAAPTREWLREGKRQKRPRADTILASLGSTYDEMRTLAEKHASGLRIIDGKVYRKIDEPVFTFRGQLREEIVIHIGDTCFDKDYRHEGAVRGPFETAFVRLGDVNAAVEKAMRIALNRANIRYRFMDLRIEIPEAFTFDEAENTVARGVGKMIYEYARVSPLCWDRTALSDFIDIHRDYLAYLEEPDGFDITDIMYRLRDTISSQNGLANDKYIEFLKVVEFAENAPLKIKIGGNMTHISRPR
jgi:hypothetical protein